MEVHIFKLVTSAVLMLSFVSSAQASPNLNFSSTTKQEEIPFKLNYSPIDYEYGKELVAFYSDLQRNEFKKSAVKKLLSYKNKKHAFEDLGPTIERIEEVGSISDQESFYKNCTIKKNEFDDFASSLKERLNLALDKYCRHLFLKNMQAFPQEITLSTRDMIYLKQIAPYLVLDENYQIELTSFVKHYKDDKAEHEKISNILIDEYIKNKIKPTPAVLAYLRINTILNKFLQNNLELDTNSNHLFQKEFQKLIKKSQEAAGSGEYLLSKQLAISAVSFYNKNKKFIDQRKAWVDTNSSAKSLFYIGRDSDAVEIFALAKNMAPPEEASEAAFYLLWPHLINKDYLAMKNAIDKNNLEKNFDKHHSKLKYWIAYALLKNGDVKKASAYFNKIVDSNPYSFYSIISLKELAALNKELSKEEILAKLVSTNISTELKMDHASDGLRSSLKRLAVWNAVGYESFAILEIRLIESLSRDDTFKDVEFSKTVSNETHREFLVLNLVRLLYSQKDYLTSFKLFQNTLAENSQGLNYRLIKYIFPLNYLSLIKKNANSIDPLIVISLIRQESAFNPMATSSVGAKGLMQLMPETAKRFNRRVKVKHLGDPEINVALGSKYLKQLLMRFDGNLIYALASYNAGENRIDRWKREIFRNEDPLATIESIPFEETRNYVKLIYRNNFFYSLLSDRPLFVTPIDESFKVSLNTK